VSGSQNKTAKGADGSLIERRHGFPVWVFFRGKWVKATVLNWGRVNFEVLREREWGAQITRLVTYCSPSKLKARAEDQAGEPPALPGASVPP